MDKCGIICEYNPFHNGHLYHIKKSKEYVDASIVCVMSGDFVLRAEPAMFDKLVRAKTAINFGADIVVEIPAPYSIGGGKVFAYASLKILSKIKDLKYLSFGIETDNNKIIEAVVDIQLQEDKQFKENLKNLLKKGLSYALSYSLSTVEELIKKGFDEKECTDILKAPNNILAIEYLKAIKLMKLDITPIYISRCDKGYNSLNLTPPYASATAIRSLIEKKQNYSDFVPFDFGFSPINMKSYEAIVRSFLLSINDKSAQKFTSLSDIIMSKKTKNLTYTHIKRDILLRLLNISKDILDYRGDFFYRLLAIKNSFLDSLKEFSNILIQFNDQQKITDSNMLKINEINKSASDLYSVITSQESNRYSIVKV